MNRRVHTGWAVLLFWARGAIRPAPVPALAAAAPADDPLAAQVTICRDTYGVPHIVGETQEATFFGYGYAQAQDHLEEMMLQYRDAQGRRAEVLGFEAIGEEYLQFIPYDYRWDRDYLQRLLRTRKGVVEKKNEIDPKTYRILDGFARGVNAYIDEQRSQVPTWIDHITAEDIEALERSHLCSANIRSDRKLAFGACKIWPPC